MILYPAFGICGTSGSGKTTLIVELIQRLHSEASERARSDASEQVSAGGPAYARPSVFAKASPDKSVGGPAHRSPWGEGGLKVGVIKHDVHGLTVDHEGKDSDRFFKAGADVLMQGPGQMFLRAHPGEEPARARPGTDLKTALALFCPHYDLVLLEGHKSTPFIDKVWLLKDDRETCPPEVVNVRRVLRRDEDRAGIVMEMLRTWLTEKWLSTPVYAGVLIGGESLRMGRPKHLITLPGRAATQCASRDCHSRERGNPENSILDSHFHGNDRMEESSQENKKIPDHSIPTSAGRTWIELIVESIQPLVKQAAILGKGEIPKSLARLPVLPDVENAQGPLAGILSAMRWRPDVSWLFLSCDMPRITADGVRWLLANRKPGVWAILPRRTESENVEPLPGWYDFRALRLLETCRGPAGLAGHKKVATPLIPGEFISAWTNVNTVFELDLCKYVL